MAIEYDAIAKQPMRLMNPAKWMFALLLAIHSILLSVAAFRDFPTYDEVQHITAGVHLWEYGRLNVGYTNPPLPRLIATLPLQFQLVEVRSSPIDSDVPHGHWDVCQSFANDNKVNLIAIVRIARHSCFVFSWIGAFICFRWASEISGRVSAGLIAACIWCFCPMVIGHGHLATVDIASTAIGVCACFCVWKWTKQQTWGIAVWSGIFIGLACLCKFSWLLLPCTIFVLGIVLSILTPKEAFSIVLQSFAILLLSATIINCGYGFEGTLLSVGSYHDQHLLLGVPNLGSALEMIPVPFPRFFVMGIDVLHEWVESKPRSYLLGEWKSGGWWYYYFVGIALKSTVGLQALLIVGIFCWTRISSRWNDHIPLIIACLFMAALSSASGVGHHLRYAFPILPLLSIWLAASISRLDTHAIRLLSTVGLAMHIMSSLWVFPHSVSYFNELGGGPLVGHRYFLNSNLDWGQDLFHLRRWLDRNCDDCDKIYLAYFGTINPSFTGIKFEVPDPSAEKYDDQLQFVVVSANFLYGYQKRLHDDSSARLLDGMKFGVLRELTPTARVGYSLYVFRVDEINVLLSSKRTSY